jgi:hypothetical protein
MMLAPMRMGQLTRVAIHTTICRTLSGLSAFTNLSDGIGVRLHECYADKRGKDRAHGAVRQRRDRLKVVLTIEMCRRIEQAEGGLMKERQTRIVRQGRIYNFRIADVEYRAFIWSMGRQFCGRVEDEPQVPQMRGRTALAVRDMLSDWLTKAQAS